MGTRNNRILIIDDDPGVRKSFEDILSPNTSQSIVRKGRAIFGGEESTPDSTDRVRYEFTMAERGEVAIQAVKDSLEQEQPFATAFADMKMPGISGAETVRRIWEIDPRIKVVVVTAYSEYKPDDIINVIGVDEIFYLRKPFNPEEIRQFAKTLTNQWNLEQEKESLSSQLKKANEELEDMNRNLQHKVEEQASMLIHSEKMASLGILTAGVAHEINNPISFVQGNLSTLKKYAFRIKKLLQKYGELESHIGKGSRENMDFKLREIREAKERYRLEYILEDIVALTEECREGTSRVNEIVRNLKSFSTPDQADLKPIDLNETIDANINILWNELKHKIEVKKVYGSIPQIKGSPQKISQVLMNVLMNAAQAIEDKGAITIRSRYVKEGRREDDEKVEIRISDTGKGIPKHDITKIFDPFFTTKAVGEGTGLGLNISYDIVKAHGGKIRVEAEEGSGSTFIIVLPLEPKL